MATRTLDVALWEYRDLEGQRRRAYYRETFDLPDSEVERGERAGVFAPADDSATTPVAAPEALPPRSRTHRELVDWLVDHRGADRNEVKGLTKAALWRRIENADTH
jgi:hypothetical protein